MSLSLLVEASTNVQSLALYSLSVLIIASFTYFFSFRNRGEEKKNVKADQSEAILKEGQKDSSKTLEYLSGASTDDENMNDSPLKKPKRKKNKNRKINNC